MSLAAKANPIQGRYFYDGDGKLNVEGGERKLDNLSERLIALIDYLQDRFTAGKGKVTIYSGYRSPNYNEALRRKGKSAAKASLHMEGMAVDFSLQGVASKDLWHIVREMNCCGAGHYGGETIHLDTGPPRFWEQATSKVFTDIADHNKRIYATTEYDIYHPGEWTSFKLVQVTKYPFGVANKVELIQGKKKGGTISLQKEEACIPIRQRKDLGPFLLRLPDKKGLSKKPTQIKVSFCSKPSMEMPDFVLSNPFVIQ